MEDTLDLGKIKFYLLSDELGITIRNILSDRPTLTVQYRLNRTERNWLKELLTRNAGVSDPDASKRNEVE